MPYKDKDKQKKYLKKYKEQLPKSYKRDSWRQLNGYKRGARTQEFLDKYPNFDWNKLSEAEVKIIKEYYFELNSYQKIGDALGISKQAVQQKIRKAIKK